MKLEVRVVDAALMPPEPIMTVEAEVYLGFELPKMNAVDQQTLRGIVAYALGTQGDLDVRDVQLLCMAFGYARKVRAESEVL